MPTRYTDRILRHLQHDRYSPTRIDQLAEDLQVPEEDRDDFRAAVRKLEDLDQVVLTEQDRVVLPPVGDEVTGVFKRNPRGFGFIIPRSTNAHGDLFVPPHATMEALTGDLVRAEVHRDRRPRRARGKGDSPFYGQIVEILERKQSNFTGEISKRGGQWLVFPDGKALDDPIIVRDVGAKNAREGDKVVVELTVYPEGDALAEGVITKVLGDAGEPDVETQAIIEAYSLPGEFPEECLEQTRAVTQAFDQEIERIFENGEAPKQREDRTGDFIITIDPPDARDFDDAISLERTEDGWRLGIHIADVAHFIPSGSPLDEEAAQRGNSVYLPRLVIPMLPELLSNGICSLQEGVPRFCKSAYIEYDRKGNVLRQGVASTVIKSDKRLTYLEAQALIDGNVEEAKKHTKSEPEYSEQLVSTLKEFDRLARAIRERRRRAGMIHLDLPDVELIFDDEGHVVDAEPEDDAFTHTIIEMFMVEANEAVARLFENLQVPLLRRVHPDPTPGDFDDLRDFVKVAGYRIPKNPTREELQGLLDATAGTPAAPAVHMAVLRTLTKAEYSPHLIGHFALASEAYAHFTSPIRRYPDLTVHRALAEYLKRTDNGASPPSSDQARKNLGKELREGADCPDEQTLVEIGRRCSTTEQNASDAERELRSLLVMQMLAERIGEEYEGVVTGVANAGVFVRLNKYLIEGMIRTSDLPVADGKGGRWRIDPRSGALVHEGSGRSFRMGDRLAVLITNVDLPHRKLDLVVSDEEAKKRAGVGKALTIGSEGGGLGSTEGAGGENLKKMTGGERRSRRSKSRDRRKADHRKERKGKGKRQ